MAITLRLSPTEDETLNRLAKLFAVSKNSAAAAAFDMAAPKPDHEQFVRDTTERLMRRYAGLLGRLSEA